MRPLLNLSLILCLFSINIKAQTNQYKQLLDSAINFNGQLFVSIKPITKIALIETELKDYFYYYSNAQNSKLDTVMLLEIIKNSKSIDTTFWTDSELDKFILVKNRSEDIKLSNVIQKFKLTDKSQIKYYRKKINQFNSTEDNDKNIYYYSRPVFDNSKKFSIIEWDNVHGSLCCGGGIALYKLEVDTWKKLGNLEIWQY